MGEVVSEDGTHLSFTIFEAPDGVKLTAICHEFDSPIRAKEQFDKEIAKATKVLKRGEKKDRTGKTVGERAEAMVRSGALDNAVPAVLWTYGRHFHEVMSSSSRDNLRLEKKYTY